MEYLFLGNNAITSVNFRRLTASLPNLKALHLENNKIAQCIDLSVLPSLISDLSLQNNKFFGCFDYSTWPWPSASNLNKVFLAGNSLSGVINFGQLPIPRTVNYIDLKANVGLFWKARLSSTEYDGDVGSRLRQVSIDMDHRDESKPCVVCCTARTRCSHSTPRNLNDDMLQ